MSEQVDSHRSWVCLLRNCVSLWKSTNYPWVLASVWWGLRCGFATNSSPFSCTCSFALYQQTGLGSSINSFVAHELEVSTNHRPGEILSHEVRRIVGSQKLSHLELVEVLFFAESTGC